MHIKFSLTAFLLLLLALFGGAASVVRAQKLISFVEQEKLGYKDARGNVVIPARFVLAGDFSKQGLAYW